MFNFSDAAVKRAPCGFNMLNIPKLLVEIIDKLRAGSDLVCPSQSFPGCPRNPPGEERPRFVSARGASGTAPISLKIQRKMRLWHDCFCRWYDVAAGESFQQAVSPAVRRKAVFT